MCWGPGDGRGRVFQALQDRSLGNQARAVALAYGVLEKGLIPPWKHKGERFPQGVVAGGGQDKRARTEEDRIRRGRKRGATMNWKRATFWSASLVPVLVLGFLSQASWQERGSIETLIQRLERGDYNRLDELLEREEEALPVLLKRARHPRGEVRVTALDLLARIDLKDDGVLNRDEVIRVMVEAIDGSEKDPSVVDEALNSLQKIDPRKVTPALVDALLTQLKNGRARAARVLGQVGDPSLIPRLTPFLASPDKAVIEVTRQALAKLGDQRFLAEILAELDVEGPVQAKAFEKLAYIGNPSTVRKIAQFLYAPGAPPSVIGPRDRVGYLPYSHMAAWALGQIVDNPPVKKDLGLLTEQDIETWKAWWDAHQHEYP